MYLSIPHIIFITLFFSTASYLLIHRGIPRGVKGYVLGCDILLNEFELLSSYYI